MAARRQTVRKRARQSAKPGLKSLREIRKLQTSTDLSIPKRDFQNLVREVCRELEMDYRFKLAALEALQEAAENVLITEFDLSNQEAIHAKRVTLQIKDMEMVQKIRRGLMGYGKLGENSGM